MSTSNLHTVTTNEQFQELLSQDLQKVSVINFWAPWAEPCKQMNEVVVELAKKYPQLLALNVEAENLPDIAESFDIEAVPAFIILRGHTLLGRIAGADATGLANVVSQHISSPGIVPLATTEKQPEPAPATADIHVDGGEETEAQLNTRMKKIMEQSKVVLFMKGSPDAPRCGFSRRAVGLLRDQGTEFTHFDILEDEAVRQGLKTYNNWPTFPQLIVNGDFVGGLDIVQEMVDNGEYAELLNQ